MKAYVSSTFGPPSLRQGIETNPNTSNSVITKAEHYKTAGKDELAVSLEFNGSGAGFVVLYFSPEDKAGLQSIVDAIPNPRPPAPPETKYRKVG